MKIDVSPQVAGYLRALAPEPRQRFRAALKGLGKGEGDIRELTDELAGYWRLRVGSHRVVFHRAGGEIRCPYVGRRSTVYEYAAAHLRDLLGRD